MIRRSRLLMLVLPAVACLALSLAVLSIARSNTSPPPPAEPRAARSAGTVAGAGVVEPSGRDVSVATPVAGVVRDVRVKPGDAARQGDILFVLDDAIPLATLEQRRRDLRSAELRLEQTRGRVAQLRARKSRLPLALSRLRAPSAMRRRTSSIQAPSFSAVRSPSAKLTRRRNAMRSAEGRLLEAMARHDSTVAALALIDPVREGASYLGDVQAVRQARRLFNSPSANSSG